ncbi:MAG: phosphoenolpyruvate--protein phosphotransferase [Woeseiaceae bacterium]
MPKLVLAAPLSGWMMPLDEVPDPAFAGRMVGDGAAIDPTDSILRAPCDGLVTMLAEARHALTLRADTGAEILLHVGIDTVALRGDGLAAKVAQGQKVQRGDPLLELDLDRLARRATSLVTPVVVTNADRFPVAVFATGRLVSAGEPFFETAGAADLRDDAPLPAAQPDAAGRVTVLLQHGFHARPAARLARAAREYRARVVISAHGRDADAHSTVALMSLGVRCGDDVELRGFGIDAARAVRALTNEISSGLGESPVRPLQPLANGAASAALDAAAPRDEGGDIRGTVASRGLAVGVAKQFQQPDIEVAEQGRGVALELADLARARDALKARLRESAHPGAGEILGVQAEFLDDPALLGQAHTAIRNGKSAGHAWRTAIRAVQDQLRATGDRRLAERVADLQDVETQVLQALASADAPARFDVPEHAIVLAHELLPSQFNRLDFSKVAGFCSAAGGPTSHVALLAASRGIPAIVGAGPSILEIPDGTPLLLDADAGSLIVEPDAAAIAAADSALAARRSKRTRYLKDAARDCYTADGCRIEVFANLASVADAERASLAGAEGCGLLRTEFLFLDRSAAPSQEEQAAEYQAIADALGGCPLVIRTLDAGGDKPIAYLPLPREENPLLGLRGLRASLRFPQLLREQLGAILRVEPPSQCRILLPMITGPGEIRAVREIVDALARERQLRARVPLGAMIETPAAVVLAAAIAREADFLSIGSNDLTQYTLAMDRTHPEFAASFEFFHPVVLHQVAAVCAAGEATGRTVSICGALASDPGAAPFLIGLGVRTLSAVSAVIPELKSIVRGLSLGPCRELAQRALRLDDARSLQQLADRRAAGET